MRKYWIQLSAGIALLVSGGYWFFSNIYVTTSYFGLSLGSMKVSGGLVIVPFLIGIVWLLVKPKTLAPKILTVAGLLIIILSVISSTRFVIRNMNLFEYLLILTMIFTGGALIAIAMFSKKKS